MWSIIVLVSLVTLVGSAINCVRLSSSLMYCNRFEVGESDSRLIFISPMTNISVHSVLALYNKLEK